MAKDDDFETCSLYIGSGTEHSTNQGVSNRWDHYDNGMQLPSRVKALKNEGWKIVHKGTLAWVPLPSAGKAPRLRLLFILFEAALTAWFWAVDKGSSKKPTAKVIAPLCPWPVEAFEYSGLCTHTPLIEGMKTSKEQFGIAPEILDELHKEATARARRMKNIVRPAVYRAQDRVKFNAQSRAAYARDKKRGLETKYKSATKAYLSLRFFCDTCSVPCTSQYVLDRHNKSEKHRNRVNKKNDGILFSWSCKFC